jgi:hypothetical protein
MTRFPVPNKFNPEYVDQVYVPQSSAEFAEYQRSVPAEVPAGYRAFVRWEEFEVPGGASQPALRYGIEPIDPNVVPVEPAAPVEDKPATTYEQLAPMTKAQLIGRGAELELELDEKMTKTVMINLILGKLAEAPGANG